MHREKTKCLLRDFEIDRSYQGFYYCVYSMDLTLKRPESLSRITKELYPEIAKKYNTSCGCVERDIRTVAEIIWKKGGKSYFHNLTGMVIPDERPSNAKFLVLLANCVIWEDYPCKKCELVTELKSKINTLTQMNMWMHDLIWELLRKIKH